MTIARIRGVPGRLAGRSRALPLLAAVFLCAVALASLTASAGAQGPVPATPAQVSPSEAQGLRAVLALLPSEYAAAIPTHDQTFAAIARALASGARTRVLELPPKPSAQDAVGTARTVRSLDRLTTLLRATTVRLQPWPLALEVATLSERAARSLGASVQARSQPPRPYAQIDSALQEVGRAAGEGHAGQASFALLRAYSLYGAGPGRRLRTVDPALDRQITAQLLLGAGQPASLAFLLSHGGTRAEVEAAGSRARSAIALAAQTLGEVRVARATMVANAAIIVFREGLEAVLILAAITASFVGTRRRLRKPVLLGGLAGLVATALTWVVAQMILHALGNGGLELQAVTGLLAIAVLLLVTNWFFHRVYWSEWISRFNRRRRALERLDRLGFVSGQVLGFVLLGLSSVYREGLETVLFLQALQSSAGTGVTALGAGIGLAGTLAVGTVTFTMQRKLPFKRMLIVTGVLIALVLAVMVGTTVHTLQGIGWLPIEPTSFAVSPTWSQWLGMYPTWEGIGAQLLAVLFVLGSYLAAREVQVKRPQRRSRRTGPAIAPAPVSGAGT